MTDEIPPRDESPSPREDAEPHAPVRRRRLPASYRLEVGDVIGSTFTAWFSNFVPFTLMALLVYSPIVVAWLLFLQSDYTRRDFDLFSSVTNIIEGFFLSNILAAAVIYAVFEHLRGRSAGIGRSLSTGLARMFPVLGAAILVGLSVLLGLLLLIIPGIIFACILSVTVPAVVVERAGPVEAMRRSAELTKGNRMTIFGIYVLIFLIMFGMGLAIGLIAGIAVTPRTREDVTLFVLISTVLGIVIAPLQSVLPAVIYHRLRVGREGVDVDDLVGVFE